MRRDQTDFERMVFHRPAGPRRDHESGVVIMLVAVVMLFVVGAMAALSIDVVTIYTARSEAQLAADSAALAAARVLANSGTTSDTTGSSLASAWNLATAVALQVAIQNQVGGAKLTASQVTVPAAPTGFTTNPTFTVSVKVTNLPTFFARIWGSKFITVSASAAAEAYNPSSDPGSAIISAPPVAPLCVKPWLLPNMDPTGGPNPIFDSTGGIESASLLGESWPIYSLCNGDCSTGSMAPSAGEYYPGAIDADDFPAPTQALPACSALFNPYQLAVAGCVPLPIACGTTPTVKVDVTPYVSGSTRDADTVVAASCLIHDDGANGDADSIQNAPTPSLPFQFVGGKQNPIANAYNKNVPVSDSLVTIPVINTTPTPPTLTNPSVTVVGFLQVFLNPTGGTLVGASPAHIPVTIINMAGCGSKVSGTPIFGNGASPVAVRLISP